MLTINLSPEAREKIKTLLAEDDDYDEPLLRIREVKVGGGWTSHNELRLSIDERDELEDEVEAEFEGLPFILHPDIVSAYGETYNIALDKDDAVVVTSAEAVKAVECSLFRPRWSSAFSVHLLNLTECSMLNITLSAEVVEKLKSLLEEEDNDEAMVRIREVKAGAGWKSHMELRLSIDERDDLEDELEATVEGIPFIVHPDVTDTYGKVFSIVVNPENGQPKVSTPNGDAAASSCGN